MTLAIASTTNDNGSYTQTQAQCQVMILQSEHFFILGRWHAATAVQLQQPTLYGVNRPVT